MQKEIECRIIGRVQLVMYRDFAQRKARTLGITGAVQNVPDGSVRVIAQGSPEVLEKYVQMLRKGPLLARVDKVEAIWRDPRGTYEKFLIIH